MEENIVRFLDDLEPNEIIKDVKKKVKNLEERNRKLKKHEKIADEGKKNLVKLLDNIQTEKFRALIEDSWERLQNGRLKLDVMDFYRFWTDLHKEFNIITLKCTSRINPEYWSTPEMELYTKRQIKNIEELEGSQGQYERIFLLDEYQIESNLNSILTTIKEQVMGGIDIKILPIKYNEKPTFNRPQDFGIIKTEEDKLAMYLSIDIPHTDFNKGMELGKIKAIPQGGLVTFNDSEIEKFDKQYSKLKDRSYNITKENLTELKEIIKNKDHTDISDIYGNRCVECLIDAEKKIESGDWREEKTAKKTWYEINYYENKAVENIVRKIDPSHILEIGCGPGKIINLLDEIREEKETNLKSIEAYEQNTEIFREAQERTNVDEICPKFVGWKKSKSRLSDLEPRHENRFDLILAVSNLVGWQPKEIKFIEEVLRAAKKDGKIFFTVYRDGYELERARMYEESGDFIQIKDEIEIITDAFRGETRISKSYTLEEINQIIKELLENNIIEEENYKIIKVGKYLWGVLLKNKA